jgi:hypothetical protein
VRIGDTSVNPATVLVLGSESVIGLGVATQFRVIIDHNHSITFEV